MSRYSLIRSPLTVVLLLGLLVGTGSALSRAQGPVGPSALSAVGTTFTYQGHLTQDGSPANGPFDLSFSLYDDPDGGTQVGGTVEVENRLVTDGVFTVELDFGDQFDGTPLWLEIGVRPGAGVGAYTVLSPRQRLSPAPYAAYATRASWAGLTGVPVGLDDGDDDSLAALSCADGQLPKWDSAGGQWACAEDIDTDTTYSPGTGLVLTGTVLAITTTYQLPQTCAHGQVPAWDEATSRWVCTETTGGSGWSLTGNAGTVPGTDYLGTTDNVALELHVNGERAWRLEPGVSSPNIVGGYLYNSVSGGAEGAEGATIGGGGRELAINNVSADYATISGGAGNAVAGYAGTIGGGEGNAVAGSYAIVGGGSGNAVEGDYATVGGGRSNSAASDYATVGGGMGNVVTATFATVGGGAANVVTATYGTVAGGAQNLVTGSRSAVGGGEDNAAKGDYATVGGGRSNSAAAAYGTIAGGGPMDPGNPTTTSNRVYGEYGTIGGGGGNVAGDRDGDPTLQQYTTVAGGQDNAAAAQYAAVGGGTGNSAGSYAATVGGGSGNNATNQYATVGGGQANSAAGNYATVGGGSTNVVTAAMGTVSGGSGNTVTGTHGTIPGGVGNVVGASYAFAAGSQAHAEHQGTFVWSDSTGSMASTGPDQFLIDADGGVGIGTNVPTHMLTVEGSASVQGSTMISVGVIPSNGLVLEAPRAVYASDDLLYVASYATNTLSVWDVSDPAAHALVGYTTFQLQGPVDLQVVGTRAYLASQNSNSLTVLDVSDPSNPSHVHDTNEHLGRPQGVHVSGKYAYVASKGRPTPAGLYDGLTVFDVTDAPAEIAATSFVTTYLQGTSDVFVSGSYAYVTSRDNDRLVVFDVSDPRAAVPVTYTQSLSAPVQVHVSGIYAYVVARDANALVIYNVSDPVQIAYAGQITTTLHRPRSIYASGGRAYVAYEGDEPTGELCGLAVLDISDPADIAVLNVIDMSDWLMWVDVGTVEEPIWIQVPPKPVAVTGSGDRVYVANERHDSVTIFEIDGLEASAVHAGELQVAHLEVADYAAIEGDLGVRGGLNVGLGGALIQGTLSVEGTGDSYIQGRLGIGPVSTAITVGESISDYNHYTLLHPTHQLDVDGEARFRVNDYNHLVLRSPNTGSDEDAYIDFAQFTYPDLITPSARIEFDAADPITHSTSIRFSTRAPGDPHVQPRIEISDRGNLRPSVDGAPLLGEPERRWDTVYTVNGVDQSSDGRYKENVRALPYGLDSVAALRPVVFAWRGDPEQVAHYGLIAQEVREILPEIVSGSEGEDSTLSLNYSELVPVLVRAVQEQQDQIAALEAHLAALEQGTGGDGPGLLRLPGIAGLGGLLACGLVVVEVRKRRQSP